MSSPLLRELIDALRILPGVGPKSAQRMALSLLERQRPGGLRLARALEQALQRQVQRLQANLKCKIVVDTSACAGGTRQPWRV